ncbi:hypothetical protein' [Enterococcus faecium]|nr:hypothetical protein' [Enterococcus faecium]
MVALLNRGVFGTTYSWIFFTTVPNDFYRMDTEKKQVNKCLLLL